MDSSSVLTALREVERWQARKGRLEERLEAVRRRRAAVEAELERVSQELARLAETLYGPEDRPADLAALPPFRMGG